MFFLRLDGFCLVSLGCSWGGQENAFPFAEPGDMTANVVP